MTTTLEKLFALKNAPKKFAVNVQVLDNIGSNRVEIRDNSKGTYFLDVSKAQYYMQRYIQKGKFVKILSPVVKKQDQTLMIDGTTIMANGKLIEGLTLNSTYATIASTFDLGPQVTVSGNILAKIVKKYEPKIVQGRYGQRTKHAFTIKDLDGNRQLIGIWSKTSQAVGLEEGKTYVFSCLKTENFPDEKPHILLSDKISNIVEATPDLQKQFDQVEFADGKFSGKN